MQKFSEVHSLFEKKNPSYHKDDVVVNMGRCISCIGCGRVVVQAG